MLLSGDRIKAMQLIRQDRAEGYRAASYDLGVGRIIPPLIRSKEPQDPSPAVKEVDSFVLPGQGMVEVVSSERVKLPQNIAGYATVKTGLCDKGILALNIGLIDPGYEGLISSTLINFGKSEFNLTKGEPFLRLTFFEYAPSASLPTPPTRDDSTYIKDKQNKVLQHLSPTFLNLEHKVKELTRPVVEEWTSGMFRYVGVGSLLLALLAFLVTIGSGAAARALAAGDNNNATELMRQFEDSTRLRLDRLRSDLDSLRRSGIANSARTAPVRSQAGAAAGKKQ